MMYQHETYYVYPCEPIDFWDNFIPFSEFIKTVELPDMFLLRHTALVSTLAGLKIRGLNFNILLNIGFYKFTLPNISNNGGGVFEVTLTLIKIDDHGTTFVISPIKLDYLNASRNAEMIEVQLSVPEMPESEVVHS